MITSHPATSMEFCWGGLWEHEQRIVKLEALHEKDRKRLLWYSDEKRNQALTSFRIDLKRLEEKVELQIHREVASHFDVCMEKLKVTEREPAQKVKHLDATVRGLQDIHQDLVSKVEKAIFGETKIADLEQQVKILEETVAKTAQTLNRSESQSEVSKLEEAFEAMKRRQEDFNLQMMEVQLASKSRELGGRIEELGQDMQVVKEAILHMQQGLRTEVVIPELALKDLDAKTESRLDGCAKSVASLLQESDWEEDPLSCFHMSLKIPSAAVCL